MASDEQQAEVAELERDLLDTPAAGPAAIRGGIIRVSGYITGVLLSLVSAPLLIRHLRFGDYGRYVIVISIVTVVQGVTDVGLGQIGVREFAIRSGTGRTRMMRNLIGLRFALTSAGVGLGVAFAAVAGYGRTVLLGTVFAGLAMVITVAQGGFAVPLAAQLRLGWVSALELFRQVLAVTAIVILVLAGAGLLPFLIALLPVSVIVLGATLVLVRRTIPMRPSWEWSEWVVLMRAVLPFAAAVVIGTVYLRVTVILMSLLTSALQNGYYATSFTVISVLMAIPSLTVGSTLPILSRAARDDRDRLEYVLQRLVEVTLIIGVGLGIGLVFGAGFIVQLLTGGNAGPTVSVLQIQSIVLAYTFVGTAWQYGLLSLHLHRASLVIAATGLAVSVIVSLALIPALDARGAAIGFASAEIIVVGGSFIALHRARPDIRFSLRVPSRVLLGAALAAAVALVPGLPSIAAAAIAGAIYLGVLVATRAIPAELLQALPRRAASP